MKLRIPIVQTVENWVKNRFFREEIAVDKDTRETDIRFLDNFLDCNLEKQRHRFCDSGKYRGIDTGIFRINPSCWAMDHGVANEITKTQVVQVRDKEYVFNQSTRLRQ